MPLVHQEQVSVVYFLDSLILWRSGLEVQLCNYLQAQGCWKGSAAVTVMQPHKRSLMADQGGILLQMVIIAAAAILWLLKHHLLSTYAYVRILLTMRRLYSCRQVKSTDA